MNNEKKDLEDALERMAKQIKEATNVMQTLAAYISEAESRWREFLRVYREEGKL
jgi:cell division septum initiation protein DivIVA